MSDIFIKFRTERKGTMSHSIMKDFMYVAVVFHRLKVKVGGGANQIASTSNSGNFSLKRYATTAATPAPNE